MGVAGFHIGVLLNRHVIEMTVMAKNCSNDNSRQKKTKRYHDFWKQESDSERGEG